jgi:hypothetical protein
MADYNVTNPFTASAGSTKNTLDTSYAELETLRQDLYTLISKTHTYLNVSDPTLRAADEQAASQFISQQASDMNQESPDE